GRSGVRFPRRAGRADCGRDRRRNRRYCHHPCLGPVLSRTAPCTHLRPTRHKGGGHQPGEVLMKAANILETIGNTPHIRVNKLFGDAEVWIKSGRSNPAGSIKDRIALAMIEAAEASGELKPGGTIVEPTSGNTGVGLAM